MCLFLIASRLLYGTHRQQKARLETNALYKYELNTYVTKPIIDMLHNIWNVRMQENIHVGMFLLEVARSLFFCFVTLADSINAASTVPRLCVIIVYTIVAQTFLHIVHCDAWIVIFVSLDIYFTDHVFVSLL